MTDEEMQDLTGAAIAPAESTDIAEKTTPSDYRIKTNKFLSVLKSVFVNNWQLKITAVVTAAVIWGLAVFL